MILTGLINLAYYIVNFVIGLLPEKIPMPSEVITAVAGIGQYLYMLDPLVPIATLLTCVGIVFSVELGIFGFKSLKWIIAHIPYVGGHK